VWVRRNGDRLIGSFQSRDPCLENAVDPFQFLAETVTRALFLFSLVYLRGLPLSLCLCSSLFLSSSFFFSLSFFSLYRSVSFAFKFIRTHNTRALWPRCIRARKGPRRFADYDVRSPLHFLLHFPSLSLSLSLSVSLSLSFLLSCHDSTRCGYAYFFVRRQCRRESRLYSRRWESLSAFEFLFKYVSARARARVVNSVMELL